MAIVEFLQSLRLSLHDKKTRVQAVSAGVPFVGFRNINGHCRINTDVVTRFRRRIKSIERDYLQGAITLPAIRQRLQSWNQHAAYGNTYRLRQRIFGDIVFRRPQNGAGRS